MRDITLGITFYHQFTTRQFSDGVPTTLSGTPVLSVLEEGNATPITSGVSLSVDRASVTGLNEATIEAQGGNGFEGSKSYSIYISTGTVGGTSVVGEIVGQFTIRQSAAAVDLANGSDGLGAIKTETALIVGDTVDIQTQIGTAGNGLSNIGTIATCTTLTNVINAASVVASVSGNVDGNVTGSVGSNLELGPTEVNTEVDNALNTAIPGSPTTNSINERMVSVEVLASGSTGFAAIVTDLDDIKGTGFAKDTHSLIDIETYVDILDDGTSGNAKIATDVAETLVDTATTIPGTITTLTNNLATVDTVVDNLNLGIIYGAAATGTLTTEIATTDLTGYTDDQLIGRILVVTSGDAEGEATDITDYANTNGQLTFTALTLAMGNSDTFKIV